MTPYAAEWTRRHAVSVTSTICHCGDSVQVRTDRATGKTLHLDPYPYEDGCWQLDAAGDAYTSTRQGPGYQGHVCPEE